MSRKKSEQLEEVPGPEGEENLEENLQDENLEVEPGQEGEDAPPPEETAPPADKAPEPTHGQPSRPLDPPPLPPVRAKQQPDEIRSLRDSVSEKNDEEIEAMWLFCHSIGMATDRDGATKISGIAGTIASRCMSKEDTLAYVSVINESLKNTVTPAEVNSRLLYYCTDPGRKPRGRVESIAILIDEIAAAALNA